MKTKKRKVNQFNIVVIGVGGQGILTLMNVIAEAALAQGYDVKTSELHGLAQRGGSVPCQIKLGKNIHSSLIKQGNADLIIAMEPLEALRACYFASKENNTVFVINTTPLLPLSVSVCGEKYPSLEEIVKKLKLFSEKVISVNASEQVKRETGNTLLTNIYLLGYVSRNNLIPIERKFLLEGMKQVIPKKYLKLNIKMFELAERSDETFQNM